MNTFLQKHKEELISRAEWMAEQTNDLQTIKAYMTARFNDIKLSDKQKAKMARWQFVYDQLSTGRYTQLDIRWQLQNKFGISEGAAMLDIREASDVFGSTMNINKMFKIQLDIQLLDVMKQKARDTQQLDSYARLQKVQNELYKMLPDEDEVPADHFSPHQIIMKFDPSLLGIAPLRADKMKELFAQLSREHGIEDIPYELIDDEAGADPLQ